MQPGRLFVISAPSGAGKTSLVKALIHWNQPDQELWLRTLNGEVHSYLDGAPCPP